MIARKVLLLHADPTRGADLARATVGGVALTAAAGARDAIVALARDAFDMLIVDTALASPSAIDFLAKAREKRPRVLRVALVDGAPAPDADSLINVAGVCALLSPPLDTRRLLDLIAERGPTPAPEPPREPTQALQARVRELERQLAKSERDLRVARNADALLREEQLDVASLSAQRARSALGLEVEIDYHAKDLEAEVSKALDAMLESSSVSLPVLPQIGLELQRMMKQPDVSFDAVAELVKMETALASRVLSICNSPLYAGVEPVRNIQTAVARLGVRTTSDIVQTAAAEQLFKTGLKGMEDLMSKLWFHSLATAHANMLVAQALAVTECEDFFVMGLLHDIGKVLIASLIQQGFDAGLWNPRIVTPRLVLNLLQDRHNDIGVKLLEKWEYSELFTRVVGQHNDDANIRLQPEPVVVTYYSNALTRKLGYSLVAHDPAILNSHDLAQALNLTDELRERIERSSQQLIERIKESYFQGAQMATP